MAPPAAETGKNTQRRDDLVKIQQEAQARWEEAKIFESNAPATGEGTPDEKFFGNFPYPYMNGVLHLGHAFSLSKLEFASAFHRLCGKNVLFPQGFHCTGMPIKACADRLDRELNVYGCPPNFDKDNEEEKEEEAPAAEGNNDPTKFKAGKSKAAAKQGTASTQYGILKMSNIPEEEIPKFRDSKHWLYYFPPLAMRDIKLMGCGVDWRRSFITTDENPYYDSFVRWQFWTLKKRGLVVKDKRFAVYSPLDGQPCADHDRASGEGVGPQEYTLIKMTALELPGKLAELEKHGKVVFLAATLRPETMYGQTNAWVLPTGEYGAYKGLNGEVYIMGEHAARNMTYQESLPLKDGKPEKLLSLTGQELIGVPLTSPNATHERFYLLPLLTISMKKGTGVVTSVPSDAPADYRALMDLKEKAPLREKFGVKDEWVLPFDVIPIINIPEFGDASAVTVCEQLNIKSQNDKVKLEEAKRLTYLKGFTDGVLLVGPHKGTKVSEAKNTIKKEMLNAGGALVYCEPENQVMSRSGDECVVALTDQWYLLYGEENWRKATEACLAKLDTYMPEARASFAHTLGWLNQWACSRSFGLGTALPWDPEFLIESLSDSTIYMAYYTVAHMLQSGDIFGKAGAGPIKAEQMTNEVWDYIYLGGKFPEGCTISKELMAKMRREFEYWYPFDLRVSGKDLIQNHLTFALYNHTAIWMNAKWPRGMRCNGHLLLNAEKMSKSKGNFMTLNDACSQYSSDAMRVGLADAGDGLDDANFDQKGANAAILRLTKELAWIEETLGATSTMRSGPSTTFADRTFENAINICVHGAKAAYGIYKFKEAIKCGWFDLQNARDQYRFACGEEGMNADLVMRFIDVQARTLAPIAPHTCDHIWVNLLKRQGSILTAGWPEAADPDFVQQMAAAYLDDLVPSLRKRIAKAEAPPKKKKGNDPIVLQKVKALDIVCAAGYSGWRAAALEVLAKHFDAESRAFPDDIFKKVLEEIKASSSVEGMADKALKQTVMPFAKFMMEKAAAGGALVLQPKLPFDEAALLKDNMAYLQRSLELGAITVHADASSAPEGLDATSAYPTEPAVKLTSEPASA